MSPAVRGKDGRDERNHLAVSPRIQTRHFVPLIIPGHIVHVAQRVFDGEKKCKSLGIMLKNWIFKLLRGVECKQNKLPVSDVRRVVL